MKPLARMLVATAALLLAAPACVGHKGALAGGALRVASVAGEVAVQPQGLASKALHEGDVVRPGSALRTGKDGRVRLEDGADRALELGTDSEATLVSASTVSLDLGSALAQTGKGVFSFDSRGIGVRVSGGAARLERALGVLRVGTYAGTAHVDLLGQGVDIPAYRELDFADGVPVDRNPSPLTLNDGDPWDRRLLGDVLEFDREITQFGDGFNRQVSGLVTSAAFYEPFVGVPRVTNVVAHQPPATKPADTLVALVFAQRLDRLDGAASRVTRNFTAMLNERTLGATWGLIAKERGLPLQPLLQEILASIRRGTAPQAASGGGGGGGGGFGSGNPPRQSPGPQPSGSPKPKPSKSPTPPPSASPSPTPCGTLDRLLGLCGGAGTSSAGSNAPPPCTIVGVLIDPTC
ncbi:MAG: hypothetical protein E6G68_05445 [Actinobacteria bacterium]|nr:MAG: hypothetical protein E6G68_05445 [Actinomycetota bacterium]